MFDDAFYSKLISEFMKIARAKYPKFAWDEHWCWNILESRVLKIKDNDTVSSWDELVDPRLKLIAAKCGRNEEKFWAYIRKMIRNALRDQFRDPRQQFEFKKVALEDHDKACENELTEIDPALVAVAEKFFPKLRDKLEAIPLWIIEDEPLRTIGDFMGTDKSTAHRLKDAELDLIRMEIGEAGGPLDREEWRIVLKYLLFLLKKGKAS